MRIRYSILSLLAGAIVLAGCGSSSSTPSSSASSAATSTSSTPASTATVGFEGVELEQGADLAPANATQTGTVDGIQCGSSEQLAYHIHAHLAVYVNGAARTLPAGIGIPSSTAAASAQGPIASGGQCIYWLHTHSTDGVIHVESPTHRIYTLGNFFDEWHQPLSAGRVGNAIGKVTGLVNGKPWKKDPRSIPLTPHAVIQLSVGTPVAPFKQLDWSPTQL